MSGDPRCTCGHAFSSHRQDPVDPWVSERCKTCGCAAFFDGRGSGERGPEEQARAAQPGEPVSDAGMTVKAAVWKYELQPGVTVLDMPDGAIALTVAAQQGYTNLGGWTGFGPTPKAALLDLAARSSGNGSRLPARLADASEP